MVLAVLIASLALAVAAANTPYISPGGQGVLPFDPLWERVVVGTLPVPGAQVVDPGQIAMRGRFVDEGGALRLVEPSNTGESTWLASLLVEDGLVRARFIVGDRLDSSLMVRALADAAGELDRGYAVSLERDRLKLYRYEHRIPKSLGPDVKLDKPLVKGSVVELVVMLMGPFIDATVLDGATLEPRARVFARDRLYASGRVGVRTHRSQDVDSGLSMLSVGTGKHELAYADEGASGMERVLLVPPGQAQLLPLDLRNKIIETRADGQILITDAIGLERARRAGVSGPSSTDIPFKYLDPSIRARFGKAPTPTLGGLRIDEGYKDATMVEAIVRAYAERFPNITRLEEIGRTLENRPILALKISKNPAADEDEPAVFFNGGHHGGELMAIEFALDVIQQLTERYKRDPTMTRIVDNLAVWVVPLVNPDGNMRFVHVSRDHDRKNARDIDNNNKQDGTDGVDLYRNYPVRFGALGEIGSRSWPWSGRYRGPVGASEPEVQAMMRLATRERFTASIDFHTNGTLILVPYTDPGMTNPTPNEAWLIAEEIAAQLPVQYTGRRYVVQRNMYPVDGTAQDWFRFAFGTVALLVEGPTNNPFPYQRGRPLSVVGTRPTWIKLCERVLNGPAVEGHVIDEDGRPVEAEVVVDEMRPRMGETWTTRPRDGRFHRLFPGIGTYTIRFRAPGYVDKVKRIALDVPMTTTLNVTLDRMKPSE